MLKLIKCTTKSELYGRAYMRKLEKCAEGATAGKSPDPTMLMSTVFLGVKSIVSSGGKERQKDLESLMDRFERAEALKLLMSLLTPRQFMNVFPIDKTYDGDRYECKDYFYTVEVVRSMDQDSPIGDKLDDLLWDYMNMNTRLFQVEMMGLSSDIIRAQDESGIMERMATAFGTPLCYSYSDEKEQAFTGPITTEEVDNDEYYYDEPEAKTTLIKKPIPDYLKIYKGGAKNGSTKLH